MNMHQQPTSSSRRFARFTVPAGPLGWLLRALLAVVSLIFMLSALIVGAVLGTALIVWTLLRGRRPAPGLFNNQFQRARQRGTMTPPGEVIDIEVREVPGPGR